MERNHLLGFLLALLGSTAHAGVNAWTNLGPEGGYARHLVVHPTNPNIAYLGGLNFYRTVDGGATWQRHPTNFSGQVEGIAVDPTDGNRVLLVDVESVYLSTDAGVTFTKVSTGVDSLVGTAAFSADGSVVYLAGLNLFYKSTDKGVTWQRQTNPQTTAFGPVALEVDPLDSQTVAAVAQWGDTEVLVSRNGGATWQAATPPAAQTSVDDIAFSKVGPTRLWVASFTGLYVSTDYGAHWTRSSLSSAHAVATHPSAAGVLYAATYSGDILRSDNDGTNWVSVRNNAYPGIPLNIAIAPSDPTRLWIGGSDEIAVTANGGANWQRSLAGFAEPPVIAISPTPGVDRMYVARQNGGLHRLDGEIMTELDPAALRTVMGVSESPYGFKDVASHALTPDRILALPHTGALLRSTDGGASWTKTPATSFGGELKRLAYSLIDPNLILAAGNGIFKSTNGGTSWIPATGLPAAALVTDIKLSGSRAYAAVRGNTSPNVEHFGIYASSDAGSTWFAANAGIETASVLSISVEPSDSQHVLIATLSGLMTTSNGGTSWTAIPWIGSSPSPYRAAIDPVRPTTIYASQTTRRVARSIDGGASWEELPPALPPETLGLDVDPLLVDPVRPHRIVLGTTGVRTLSIEPNLSIESTSGGVRVAANSPATQRYRVRNAGPFHATGARVSVPIPATASNVTATIDDGTCAVSIGNVVCTRSELRNGASADVNLSLSLPTVGFYPLTATVSADQPDSAATNNSVFSSVTVQTVVDMTLVVSGPTSAVEATPLSYSATITNAGPGTANDVLIVIQGPSGLSIQSLTISRGSCTPGQFPLINCKIATLEPQTTIQLTINTAGASSSHQLLFGVSSDNIDPTSPNIVTISTAVTRPQSANTGGGGGGSFSLLGLVGLLGLALARGRRSHGAMPGMSASDA